MREALAGRPGPWEPQPEPACGGAGWGMPRSLPAEGLRVLEEVGQLWSPGIDCPRCFAPRRRRAKDTASLDHINLVHAQCCQVV